MMSAPAGIAVCFAEEQRKRRRSKDADCGLQVPWEENRLGKEKSKWNHCRRVLVKTVLID
jgi:hypothetical protein